MLLSIRIPPKRIPLRILLRSTNNSLSGSHRIDGLIFSDGRVHNGTS